MSDQVRAALAAVVDGKTLSQAELMPRWDR